MEIYLDHYYSLPAEYLRLGAMLTSNLLLAGKPFYGSTLILQAIFYLAGLLATILPKTAHLWKALLIPKYFLTMNLAILIGFARFLRGRQQVTWTRVARR